MQKKEQLQLKSNSINKSTTWYAIKVWIGLQVDSSLFFAFISFDPTIAISRVGTLAVLTDVIFAWSLLSAMVNYKYSTFASWLRTIFLSNLLASLVTFNQSFFSGIRVLQSVLDKSLCCILQKSHRIKFSK